jgi:2-C-methyl-D-erythritol 4-phosphate cytidylyltransferase
MMDTRPDDYSPAFWCVVPAAGKGSRMGLDFPKQYLKLRNKTILEYTLERLLTIPRLQGIILSLDPIDPYWPQLSLAGNKHIHSVDGGSERCDSVMSALNYLANIADNRDWVLVHDAARPCVTLTNILELITAVAGHPAGGILGIPVSDTLKSVSNESYIQGSVDRRSLWQAQTPQMFRVGLLRECLGKAIEQQHLVTDEASAIEFCGYQPLMVQGRSDNIKMTRPDDLALVQFILDQQSTSCDS